MKDSDNRGQLSKCYDPVSGPSDKSDKALDDKQTSVYGLDVGSLDAHLIDDARSLSRAVAIDQIEALKIVVRYRNKGLTKSDQRMLFYSRHYYGERRFLIKLVAELFELRVQDDTTLLNDSLRPFSTDILAEPAFFSSIIDSIRTHIKSDLEVSDDDDDANLSVLAQREVCITLFVL